MNIDRPIEDQIESYMKKAYTICVERDPDVGGYLAYVKEFPGCMTQGETWEEVGFMIDDAMRLWIETCLAENVAIAEPDPNREWWP